MGHFSGILSGGGGLPGAGGRTEAECAADGEIYAEGIALDDHGLSVSAFRETYLNSSDLGNYAGNARCWEAFQTAALVWWQEHGVPGSERPEIDQFELELHGGRKKNDKLHGAMMGHFSGILSGWSRPEGYYIHDLNPPFRPLVRKLMKLRPGSYTELVAPNGYDPIVEPEEALRIARRGMEFSAKGAISIRGQPSQCHGNVGCLWYKDEVEQIVTGFAYTARAHAWVAHSWGLRGGKVVETTVPRQAYFGYVLRRTEAAIFRLANPIVRRGRR